MPAIVGIRFQRVGKIYYFDPAGLDLDLDDLVIVETARGQEAGRVAIAPKQIVNGSFNKDLQPVMRRASTQDLAQMTYHGGRDEQALQKCREQVAEYKLPMKVVKVRYNFDGRRLTVYFTAEKRVDFRSLVRDLSRTLHARIEMRQLGPRDEAKLLGGIGACGKTEVCCASWLTEFTPISINMAKNQDLPLNPSSISGICGRLRCCLKYEDHYYSLMQELMPKVGEEINTPQGKGKVVSINVLKETVEVELKTEARIEVPSPVPVAEIEKRVRPPS